MKNTLLLALLLGTAVEAQSVAAQTQPAPASKKDMKRQQKARKQNGPEVYKGTVAEQRRIVTEAPGAERERDDEGDDTSGKKKSKSKQ